MKITLSKLAQPTPQQPNEISLSLFFEGDNLGDLINHFFRWSTAKVDNWEKISEHTYQALNIEEFESVYLIGYTTNLSANSLALQIIVNITTPNELGWARVIHWFNFTIWSFVKSHQNTLLGHTIVYVINLKARLKENIEPDPSLLSNLQWIHNEKSIEAKSYIVRQLVEQSGILYLIKVPKNNKEGLVYLAIRSNKSVGIFPPLAYADKNSLLAKIDIFLHKALVQINSLHENYINYSNTELEPFKRTISNLLIQFDQPLSEELSLNNFGNKLALHTDFYWHLDRLKYSIQQQIQGLNRQFVLVSLPFLANYYLIILNSHLEEINIISQKNRMLLSTAQTAFSMVESRVTKKAARLQESFNKIIAIVGIYLSSLQIFDKDFAISFIKVVDPQKQVLTYYWFIIGIRTFLAIILTAVIYFVGRWFINIFHNKSSSN